ncbi:MAG: DUF1282 family protein [Bacteroidaceae bacterium]|nr:DUF1282 family protein [Bacteroidaceae bacterium]
MNYRELFQRLFTLIASPKKAWVEITSETPRRDVMGTFVYPLIALCGLVVLVSALIGNGAQRPTFQKAMLDISGYCIALFGGFFLAAWLVDMLRQKLLGHEADMSGSQTFVGYAMGAVFAAELLGAAFPQLFVIMWVLQFYVLYIVWEGCDIVFGVTNEKRFPFTILASAAVAFGPTVIHAAFNMLSNI